MWNAFGQERLIYGSNWPVCELFAPYDVVQDIVEAYWADKGAAGPRVLFLAQRPGRLQVGGAP